MGYFFRWGLTAATSSFPFLPLFSTSLYFFLASPIVFTQREAQLGQRRLKLPMAKDLSKTFHIIWFIEMSRMMMMMN